MMRAGTATFYSGVNLMKILMVIFGLLVVAPAVRAQDFTPKGEVFGSVGGGKAFDDEGGIGNGVDFGGGIGYCITPKFCVEGAVNSVRHSRYFGNGVVFEGTGTFVSANALYYFSTQKVQPYVLGGGGGGTHQHR